MTELTALASGGEQAADMVVRHPATEEPLTGENGEPWTIRLASAYSKRYSDARHRAINRRLQKKKKVVRSQEIDQSSLEVLAAATIGWTNPPTINGELFEYSEDNAVRLYTEFPWVKAQAVTFIEDDANFFSS